MFTRALHRYLCWANRIQFTLTTYFHETQFSIDLSFILCSQYSLDIETCVSGWGYSKDEIMLCLWPFYVMMIIQVFWDMVLYCEMSSSLYVKGLYSLHYKGGKVPENDWNCMPINTLLHSRRLESQSHWCQNLDSCILLDVYNYTAWYMEVKPLQKSDNFVHSLGSADFHLHYFCILFYYKLTKICTHYCILLADSTMKYLQCVYCIIVKWLFDIDRTL